MKQKNKVVLVICLIALCLSAGAAIANPDAQLPQRILQVGDSVIIDCKNATRAAVGDPLIADVAALSTREILVNAKAPGKTLVYIWDSGTRRIFEFTIKPALIDMAGLCAKISEQIADARISVRGVGNTVIIEGVVSREAESSRAESIARAIAEMSVFKGVSPVSKPEERRSIARPEGDTYVFEQVTKGKEDSVAAQVGLRTPKVVNLIRIEKNIGEITVRTMVTASAIEMALSNPDLIVRALPGSVVLVEGKVGTEAEMAAINHLLKGWEKTVHDGKGMLGGGEEQVTIVNAVRIDTSVARQIMVRAQIVDINKRALKEFGVDWGRVTFEAGDVPDTLTATVVDQPWLIGQSGLGPFDLFGGGEIQRFDPVGARVRALEEQNKAKVLSEPNLLVLDGREARILVGGEIPIPVVQSGSTGGAAAVTVEYKEFGVRLRILPSITSENTLQLKVMPEVSALDFTNGVTLNEFRIPALNTRRAETTVNVRDGQSLIIGGLLESTTSKLVKKIPVLGDLPIIGELFKSRSFVNGESELVIIITPQMVKPNAGVIESVE